MQIIYKFFFQVLKGTLISLNIKSNQFLLQHIMKITFSHTEIESGW